jgi:hypothetical protein
MLTFFTVALRVVGLIWAIGAVLIMRNARELGDTDGARWVFAGGVLTFAAGLMLAAGSRWVLVAIQQGVFHGRQIRVLPPGAPRPSANQVRIAVIVAMATLVLVAKGALH